MNIPCRNGYYSANIKEYETVVEILGSPSGLRPGLNAEVQLRVAQLPSVVHVPVQAIFEHGDKHYCFVRKSNDWEPREVLVGDTNDKDDRDQEEPSARRDDRDERRRASRGV